MVSKVRAAAACMLTLSLTTQGTPSSLGGVRAYVDPRLSDVHSSAVSTIITGTNAANAVARVGGRTTADLWLVDAVAAVVPTDAVGRLAADPAVRSIVLNDNVKPSNEGDAIGARQIDGMLTLPEKMLAPGTAMPDGGFVSVGEKGRVTLYGKDGEVYREFDLPDDVYKTSPTPTPTGMVLVASETKDVYAFNTRGDALWSLALGTDDKLFGGVVVGANGMLHAVSEKGVLTTINSATGKVAWRLKPATSDVVRAAPAVGADGTVYWGNEKGVVVSVSAQGVSRWSTSVGDKVTLTPVFGPNNVLLVTSTDGKFVTALDATTGAKRWTFTASSKIMANPAVAKDGSIFFGTDDGYAYGVNPNGTQRWKVRPGTGKFETGAVLSRDGTQVYLVQTEDPLFALDTMTGMKRWIYALSGNVYGAPVLDADNGIILGSDGQDLVRLDAEGRATFKVKAAGKVMQAASTNAVGDTMIRLDEHKVMTIGRLPDVWDGRPDIQATADPKAWNVVNPATVDVGAHTVHLTNSSAGKPLRGTGVTVAVVDSGIYFDKIMRANQGSVLSRLFKGQADFVKPECANVAITSMGACFNSKYDASIDPYGHGTAVSSIIWNGYSDANTNTTLGIAPDANILSVRVLDENGAGTYESVIKGIQYVVQNKTALNIRVMNLSLSAEADVPYFVDPINRAVESAWSKGIVVVTAAGNRGSSAETISVPGNDPYVITVGTVNTNRTPGHWDDDTLPVWSATGPTRDGFVKPDILASGSNVVTIMHRDPVDPALSQRITSYHPDTTSNTLFRMSGTSMSAPIVAGVAALMIQNNAALTPDQVKYRLMTTARLSVAPDGNALTYNSFQQGAGRVWAPDAVFDTITGVENKGMDITADLAAGYETDADLLKHYQGPVQKILSDDGRVWLYFIEGGTQPDTWLGFADAKTMLWLDQREVALGTTTWNNGALAWGTNMRWEGGISTDTGFASWGAGRMSWGSGRMSWGSGRMSWGAGRMSWGSGRMSWGSGRMSWGSSTSLDDPVTPTGMIEPR
jgi:serine protease AprX